jgi:DNA-directed RNA polymerase specialized sigma24 family protein
MKNTVKNIDSQFVTYHAVLLPYAYNIIGDSLEAEDVVQETLSHYFMSSTDHVEHPLRYLTCAVINRSITSRKRIQARNPQ